MKKNCLFLYISFLFVFLSGQCQYYEAYPVSQRYFFSEFVPFDSTRIEACDYTYFGSVHYDTSDYKRQINMSRYIIPERQRPLRVYGLALPLTSYSCNGYDNNRIDNLLNAYKTQSCNAFLLEKDSNSVFHPKVVAKIRMGETTVAGNYFQFPEEITWTEPYSTEVCTSTVWPSIEIFFDSPYVAEDTFFVGVAVPVCTVNYMEHPFYLYARNTYNTMIYGMIHNDDSLLWYHNNDFEDSQYYGFWGGIFPIIAPLDQCMNPLRVNVKPNNRRGMSVIWDAQYGNSSFELEWGPEGFVEGTGTLITSIMPDTDYSCRVELDSLDNATAYTVRVRAQCDVTGGYSGWTEKNFLSETWYSVQAQVNNEEWGTVIGTGDYREGSVAELWAYPLGNHADFVMWNDSLGSRIRYVTVTQDTMFYAYFSCDTCGDGITAVGNDAKVAIFPNPAESHITLSAKEQILAVTIHDIHGQELMVRNGTGTETTIDTKDLPSGIYVVTVTLPSSTVTRKLILR